VQSLICSICILHVEHSVRTFFTEDFSRASFKPDATSEIVTVNIERPSGAKKMVVTFGMLDAGNDWWWAIDNVQISGIPRERIMILAEDFEGLELGPNVDESAGDEVWTDVPPEGWIIDESGVPGIGDPQLENMRVQITEQSGGLVIVNSQFINNYLHITETDVFLASIAPGANRAQTAESVRSLSPVLYSLFLDEIDESEEGFISLTGVPGILTANFVVAFIISCLAGLIFLSYLVKRRVSEYALMRAVGGTRGEVVFLVVSQNITMTIASIFVGAILGIFTTVIFFLVASPIIQTGSSYLPILVYFPIETITIAILAFLGSIFIGWISPIRQVSKVDVAQTLRSI